MATQQQPAPSEANLLQAIEMVAKEKGIDRDRLVKTIEEAILKAAQSVVRSEPRARGDASTRTPARSTSSST